MKKSEVKALFEELLVYVPTEKKEAYKTRLMRVMGMKSKSEYDELRASGKIGAGVG